ncbi:MAG: HAD-IIB family hydrolase [candidate division KSB1 bacterium]|nr:HAD-IIB family hydrolase [candidate division KSB1 bacterium]MDZ7301219.1 HAD-IIB family hydrolase [candidate division KSB1 bacterium]MDZ7310557.1 HAD-IIB family hydrolase [candidate division KSB1 bacterium]
MNKLTEPRWLFFTDLDGTLLDHDTYDFSPALPALTALRVARVPLILCSSKTHAEMKYWSGMLNIDYPFISENGGALSIPKGCFTKPFDFHEERNAHLLILLGTSYPTLRAALVEIAQQTYLPLVGFGDMNSEQIAALTGLSLEQANLAKMRDADEPFFIDRDFNEGEVRRLEATVASRGLRLTRGGRFFHLTGENDKGKAVQLLTKLYRDEWQQAIRTVGFGDSLNDLPLLHAVETPILVRNKNGEVDANVLAQIQARITTEAGPAGWNEAVLKILETLYS